MLYMLRNRPLMAAFWTTVSLSVKIGPVLILPSMLGLIQYHHGTLTLLRCISLIVGFQIIISLPFVLTSTSVKEYVERSKFTGGGRDVPGEWHYRFMAASHGSTIFWGFIPEVCYQDWPCLALKLRVGLLALNVYYFFIRRWCFPQCFSNLLNTFGKKPEGVVSQKQIRFTFEVLFLGYFLGVVQMPGGHRHFQFWFTSLYHLLLSLIGLPAISTFWVNDYFYPILHGGDRPGMNLQHKVLLGIVTWLITVGPRDNLLVDLLYLIRPIVPLDKM